MISSVNMHFPAIGKEFSMDAVSLGWVSTAYLLASAMFLVPIGRIADIYGRKKLFITGILYLPRLPLPWSLYFRQDAHWFTNLSGNRDCHDFMDGNCPFNFGLPCQEEVKALGISVASTYLGLSLGPFLGGLLTSQFGWRTIFLVNVPARVDSYYSGFPEIERRMG